MQKIRDKAGKLNAVTRGEARGRKLKTMLETRKNLQKDRQREEEVEKFTHPCEDNSYMKGKNKRR